MSSWLSNLTSKFHTPRPTFRLGEWGDLFVTARTAGNFTKPYGLISLLALASNFTCPQGQISLEKFGSRLTVKNGVAVVKNSLRSW